VIHDQTRDGAIFCLATTRARRRLVCFALKRQFVRAKYAACNGKRAAEIYTIRVLGYDLHAECVIIFARRAIYSARWMCLLSQSIMRLYTTAQNIYMYGVIQT
jgi:hypothetical protein